ncbi:MAG: hypothetical protein ABIL09_12000 [Gemmatimonadota bacterium]
MNARAKSALVLVATLVIGMVLGALLFGMVQRERFRPAMRLARPDRFMASVEEVIRPRDEAQRHAVREVLERFDEQMKRNREQAAVHMRAELDSLQTSLSPLLDQTQRQHLREHLLRHREFIRRGPPGPPPGSVPGREPGPRRRPPPSAD